MEKEYTLKGTFKKATSKEGREYEYLALKLSDTYEKKVFLQSAEKEILANSKNITNPFGK